jgi:hypothetical protein
MFWVLKLSFVVDILAFLPWRLFGLLFYNISLISFRYNEDTDRRLSQERILNQVLYFGVKHWPILIAPNFKVGIPAALPSIRRG